MDLQDDMKQQEQETKKEIEYGRTKYKTRNCRRTGQSTSRDGIELKKNRAEQG